MLRRSISAFSGHVAPSQRRGYLTVVVQSGALKAECRLSVAWKTAASSTPSIVQVVPSRRGEADASHVTVNSVGAGGVLASAELVPAALFQSKQAPRRGREKIMLDLMIWPDQSRACVTILKRNEKFSWAWQSSWSFNMQQIRNRSNSNDDNALVKVFSSQNEPHLHYKGYIGKELDAEFKVSMKTHFKVQGTLGLVCAIKRYSSRKLVADEPREPLAMKMVSHPNLKKFYFSWKEEEQGVNFKKPSAIYLAQELSKCTVDDYLDAKSERSMEEKGAFTGSPSCKGGTKFMGTFYYASPEMLALQNHNEKTDVFSLGVVYFELSGGRATESERCRRLEKLRGLLKSRKWNKSPLQAFRNSGISKGWRGDAVSFAFAAHYVLSYRAE
ncbi:hypothetical protein EJB05_19805, partial [Eragrostis curvula]